MEAAFKRENLKLGMWLFLSTEVMMFSALIGCFFAFKLSSPHEFYEYSHHLNKTIASINTLILITSSFTYALGLDFIKRNDRKKLSLCLIATILLGSMFLIFKFFEYKVKFMHHILPSTHVFYSSYFLLTGVHALHVLIGIVIMFILFLYNLKGHYTSSYYDSVEATGLYWHFVDMVWVFLFPILYLT